MRVLLAAHQAATIGGIGTVARGYAEHLPAAIEGRGTVSVARGRESGARGPLDSLGPAGAAARLWYEQAALARLSRGFDLIHLCDLRPILLSRTPFVLTIHDVDFLDAPAAVPPGARRYKAGMLRAALRKGPAAIVCVSEHTRSRLLHHFGDALRADPVVVHPGVRLDRPRWSGGGERPYFLTVSTIVPRKNHLGLLRSFRQARERGLDAEWVVAGTPGPLSDDVVAALAKEPGVRLLGPVGEGRLDDLYRDALFLATPSSAEGFGYPPLEAMARGVPTLSSNAGALPEVVGDAGALLPPDDMSGWAHALEWLSRDEDARHDLSERGSRRAQLFSWPRSAEALVAVY